MQNNDKLVRVAEIISAKYYECNKELKELYERKKIILSKLADQSIPFNSYTETEKMLDVVTSLISDITLQASIWEQVREIIFDVAENKI